MKDIKIREITKNDTNWIIKFITENWGSDKIITRGKIYHVKDLPGFVIIQNKEIIALILYSTKGHNCEIISMNSKKQNKGLGTLLLNHIKEHAKKIGCIRLWLVTTNDNLSALRFYQKRGFIIKAIYPNAIDISRKLRPEIPLVGKDGVPLRDEIELEMSL